MATSRLHKRLEKRAMMQQALINNITPKELQKTPSQKNSERLRKKLLKRAGIKTVEPEPPSDCRGCTIPCRYDNQLNICKERSLVVRCGKCGQKVRVRVVDDGDEKYYCPPCKATVGKLS